MSNLDGTFRTPTTSMESRTSSRLEEETGGENEAPPLTPSSSILCSSPMRNEAPPEEEEEEPNDSYSFMACLSPSSSTLHVLEPHKKTTTLTNRQILYDTNIAAIDEEGESPKCASLASLTDFSTGGENEMAMLTNNTENNNITASDGSQENQAIVDSASVGLMASGLAWVRRQQSNIYEATSLSSSSSVNIQSTRYPMDERQLHSEDNPSTYNRASIVNKDFAPCTPTRPTTETTAGDINNNALQVKSCPTSPSYLTAPLVTWGNKVPLGSNNTINNTATSRSRSVTSSPMKAELMPRMNPVNNIYSISSLLTGLKPVEESQNSFLLGGPSTSRTVEEDQDGDDDDDEGAIIPSLGYFCQDDTPSRSNGCSSPSRSTLARVFSRIGSVDYTDDEVEPSSKDDDEEDDSVLEKDHDENEHDIHGVAWIPPVRCVAETPARVNSCILSPLQMHQIARHVLPKGIAACQWKRIYSLARDGDSFDVCLHYARNDSKTLLVVRTTRGAIFGGYAGEAWVRNGEAHYYGNNESCLFSFEEAIKPKEEAEDLLEKSEEPTPPEGDQPSSADPCPDNRASPLSFLGGPIEKPQEQNGTFTPTRPQAATYSALGSSISTPLSPPLVHRPKKSLVDDDEDEDDDDEETYEDSLPPIRVYKYKGVNRYIQYCDGSRKMMAFGGGGAEGSFGLCVEREFQLGSTGHCDTFDNEPLCQQENFKIVDVELWGFLTGQF